MSHDNYPISSFARPYLGLKPPLEHLLGGELKHEVELLLVLSEQTEPRHAAEQRGALEQTLGVFLVQGKELAGSLPEGGTRSDGRRKGGEGGTRTS